MPEPKVFCKFSSLVDIGELKPHPRNPNGHPTEQIAMLAKSIRALGWRHPVVVSNLSGLVIAGHGRIDAAREIGCASVPVDYQDFATEQDEIAHLLADNRLPELAEKDQELIATLLEEFAETDIDMDLLGFSENSLEMFSNDQPVDADTEWEGMPEYESEDKTSAVRIIVHFNSLEDVSNFGALIGQKVTNSSLQSIWHPAQAAADLKAKSYVSSKS